MAAKTLEELTEIVEAQQKEIQRLRDVHEIANLMGRWNFGHEVGKDPEYLETMFAQKTPGTSAEVAKTGVFIDEGLKKIYKPHPGGDEMRKGTLFTHPLTTPVIEVAGDGKTAKGVWMSPGYESIKNPKTGEGIACWCYTKYGCDFVKEDGQWRMWHYHVYRVFMTPFNRPWTDEWERYERDKELGSFGGGMEPDMPTTVDNPFSMDTARELAPMPPEPYETFSETFSYGPPEKK